MDALTDTVTAVWAMRGVLMVGLLLFAVAGLVVLKGDNDNLEREAAAADVALAVAEAEAAELRRALHDRLPGRDRAPLVILPAPPGDDDAEVLVSGPTQGGLA